MSVKFLTGNTFAEGKAVLTPLIVEMADEALKQVGLESEMEKFGFVKYTPLTPDGKITSLVGPQPLKKVGEDETAPIVTMETGFEKGYKLDTYALQFKITKEFRKWIEAGAQISGADASVKQQLMQIKDYTRGLIMGGKLTMNELVAKIFANAKLATQAYGAGSASPDGVALLSASHVVKKTGATFTNLVSGALTETTLLEAINLHKLTLRSGNGYRLIQPNTYTLLIPRALETTARKILNSSGDQAGVWAGTGSNANLMNVFSFAGSRVEIVVIDMFGEPDSEGNAIGADTSFYVLNMPMAKEIQAFRFMSLWENEITMYENEATGSTFVKLDSYLGVEHFNPEIIVGYIA